MKEIRILAGFFCKYMSWLNCLALLSLTLQAAKALVSESAWMCRLIRTIADAVVTKISCVASILFLKIPSHVSQLRVLDEFSHLKNEIHRLYGDDSRLQSLLDELNATIVDLKKMAKDPIG